jgi:hypothetical protein
MLSDFDVEGIVILWLSCSGGTCDEKLELRSPRPISRWVVPHSVGFWKTIVVKRSRLLGGGELLRISRVKLIKASTAWRAQKTKRENFGPMHEVTQQQYC